MGRFLLIALMLLMLGQGRPATATTVEATTFFDYEYYSYSYDVSYSSREGVRFRDSTTLRSTLFIGFAVDGAWDRSPLARKTISFTFDAGIFHDVGVPGVRAYYTLQGYDSLVGGLLFDRNGAIVSWNLRSNDGSGDRYFSRNRAFNASIPFSIQPLEINRKPLKVFEQVLAEVPSITSFYSTEKGFWLGTHRVYCREYDDEGREVDQYDCSTPPGGAPIEPAVVPLPASALLLLSACLLLVGKRRRV